MEAFVLLLETSWESEAVEMEAGTFAGTALTPLWPHNNETKGARSLFRAPFSFAFLKKNSISK